MLNKIPQEIIDIAKELKTQDNACTAHPIFNVEIGVKKNGMADNLDFEYEWIDNNWERIHDKSLISILDDMYESGYESKWVSFRNDVYHDDGGEDILISFENYRRSYFTIEKEIVASFFTRKAAEEFIKNNSHRFSRALSFNIYVDSLYRNPEMIAVREFLKSLSDE